jgi:diguanylate cyclase (GGDEF)-like protein/PAS domain S-box-containing protein
VHDHQVVSAASRAPDTPRVTVSASTPWSPMTRGFWTAGAVVGSMIMAYVLLYLAWLVGPLGGFGDRNLIAIGAIVPLRIVAAALAVLIARDRRLDPQTRRAWLLLAIASSLYAVGTGIATIATAVGEVLSYPSIVDGLLLALYPLAFAALVSLPSVRGTRTDLVRLGFDVAIWVLGGGLVLWYIVLGPATSATGSDPLATATTIGYPLGDLLVLSGLATAALRQPISRNRRPLMLLLLGFAALFLDDVAWSFLMSLGSYVPGHPIDALWMVVPVFIALAAIEQRRAAGSPAAAVEAPSRPNRIGISLIPYLFLVAGYLALLIHADPGFSDRTRELAIVSTVLALLVVGRQTVALRENGRLLRLHAEFRSAARLEAIIQNSSDVVIVAGADALIQYVSPSAVRMLGREPSSLVARPLAEIVGEDDVVLLLVDVPATGATIDLPQGIRHVAGHRLDVECTVADLRGDPDVAGYVITVRDVSERRAYEGRLRHQAFHDGLTQLANRLLFRDRLAHALDRRTVRPGRLAVLFIDLDEFKTVNDSLGHGAGDALLVEVSHRLRRVVRSADTIARLGGDEFAVLLEDVSGTSEPHLCAERILRALTEPFELEGHRIELSTSIGIALNAERTTAEEMLQDADVAMYRAKATGKGRYVTFEPSMHDAAEGRLELEADLRHGLERMEFHLQFQPIVELATGVVVGLEALVRWKHPQRGTVSPLAFIPIAEEIGLIVPLGRWILFEACRQLAALRAEGADPSLTVSVNVSSRQLASPDLATDVATALATHGLAPANLILEITESVLVEDQRGPIETLAKIRATGVRIAIDDFGTGYSSLAYLHRLPIDILKIDKSFVARLIDGNEEAVLAEAIIQIGHALGMLIVAEGVEEEFQRDRLGQMGCDLGQGFWFAFPMDGDQVVLAPTTPSAGIVAA